MNREPASASAKPYLIGEPLRREPSIVAQLSADSIRLRRASAEDQAPFITSRRRCAQRIGPHSLVFSCPPTAPMLAKPARSERRSIRDTSHNSPRTHISEQKHETLQLVIGLAGRAGHTLFPSWITARCLHVPGCEFGVPGLLCTSGEERTGQGEHIGRGKKYQPEQVVTCLSALIIRHSRVNSSIVSHSLDLYGFQI